MAILVACPTCASKLRVPEQAVGKRIKCPRCNCTFAARNGDDSPEDQEQEQRVTERPPVSARRRRPAEDEAEEPAPRRRARTTEEDEAPPKKRRGRDEDDEEAIVARRRRREEEPEEPEEEQEAPEESDEPPRERRRKKKRKRRLRPLPDEDEDDERPAWPWWVFGGGSVALIMLVLLCLTIFLSFGNPLKFCAAYLLIALPISTVIFFAAMFLSSVILGAMEIGELHVAFVKAFILMFIVNVVSLLPIGFWLTGMLMFVVLLAGLMTMFRLDAWEARMVIFFNWVLNFGLKWILMAAILSWAMRAGSVHDDDGGRPGPGGQPAQGAEWDPGERDGLVNHDVADQDEEAVISISFRQSRSLKDADLSHMKEFPRLARLDLANTRITDAGLAHLKSCKGLKVLTVTGTRVTDGGVRDLQQALPRLQIVR